MGHWKCGSEQSSCKKMCMPPVTALNDDDDEEDKDEEADDSWRRLSLSVDGLTSVSEDLGRPTMKGVATPTTFRLAAVSPSQLPDRRGWPQVQRVRVLVDRSSTPATEPPRSDDNWSTRRSSYADCSSRRRSVSGDSRSSWELSLDRLESQSVVRIYAHRLFVLQSRLTSRLRLLVFFRHQQLNSFWNKHNQSARTASVVFMTLQSTLQHPQQLVSSRRQTTINSFGRQGKFSGCTSLNITLCSNEIKMFLWKNYVEKINEKLLRNNINHLLFTQYP